MPKIKYVGVHDEVEIADIGAVCKQGGTVDVPAELAGKPPTKDDPGEGLLAQPDNWQPVTSGKKAAENA